MDNFLALASIQLCSFCYFICSSIEEIDVKVDDTGPISRCYMMQQVYVGLERGLGGTKIVKYLIDVGGDKVLQVSDKVFQVNGKVLQVNDKVQGVRR